MKLDAPEIFLREDGQYEEVDPTEIVLKNNLLQEEEEEEEEEKDVKKEEESKENFEGYQTSEETDE